MQRTVVERPAATSGAGAGGGFTKFAVIAIAVIRGFIASVVQTRLPLRLLPLRHLALRLVGDSKESEFASWMARCGSVCR